MKINLTPTRMDDELTLVRAGDVLTLNGEAFDFTTLAEGATLPADAISSDWFAGPVTRSIGELEMTLMLPHGPNAPQETLFPAPILDPPDGPVTLPTHSIAEVMPAEAPEVLAPEEIVE